MEDQAQEIQAQASTSAQAPQTPESEPARSPISPREMVRQIYLISAVVIVLLSLAIWLMISLS